MNKKRLLTGLLSFSLVTGVVSMANPVQAKDFAGQEAKYIKLCSSSKMTAKEQKTCKEFNSYLQDKNKKLNEEAKQAKKNAEKVEASIDELTTEIEKLDKKINSAEEDLAYAAESVKKIQKDIAKKKGLLEDRMYSMQTTLNSRSFVSYLFGAENFSDFFSRAMSLSQITSYDKELIEDIQDDLDEVEKQEKTLKEAKATLDTNLAAQKTLQNKYVAKLNDENNTVASNSKQVAENEDIIKANEAALAKAADASNVGHVSQATPPEPPKQTIVKPKPKPEAKPETKPETDNTDKNNSDKNETDKNDSDKNESKPETSNPSKPSGGSAVKPPKEEEEYEEVEVEGELTSNQKTGLKIANKALTRQGYMYLYGGCHSMSEIKNPSHTRFDCSGLVSWAHYQAGVNIGTNTTRTLASKGRSISRGNLQAGDIILFSSNGSSSGIHHVGIYIGNNQMVHAPSTGKPVQVASLSYSYWQKEWYSARRLY